MNKFKGILAFMLITAMSVGIATSQAVVTTEMTIIDGTPVPEQAVKLPVAAELRGIS